MSEDSDPEQRPLCYRTIPSTDFFDVQKPAGYPHVVDVDNFDEEVDTTNLRACDGVATLLWMWKPEELHKFFDMSRFRYELSITNTGPDSPMCKDIVICRLENNVMVGYRARFDYGEKDWDPLINFKIGETGEWTATSCSEYSPRAMESLGRMVAQSFFYMTRWIKKDNEEWTTSVSPPQLDGGRATLTPDTLQPIMTNY